MAIRAGAALTAEAVVLTGAGAPASVHAPCQTARQAAGARVTRAQRASGPEPRPAGTDSASAPAAPGRSVLLYARTRREDESRLRPRAGEAEHGRPKNTGRLGEPSLLRRGPGDATIRLVPVVSEAPQKPGEEQRERERELCERAKAGDRQALGEILRTHGPVLYRSVLLPRLGSEAAAQDALADTYVRVLERFHQFEWRGCGVYPWLRVVAMRIAWDGLRARKRESLFAPDELARAADAAEREWGEGLDAQLCEKRDLDAARRKLGDAMQAINQRYALAIRLRIIEERTREQAAHELGVSVGTLDVVLHRALRALRQALAGEASAPVEEQGA
ncbi:MAG: sigma-70 family RNA polymerase sigma factor [Deltaproteobacteria bacterium]|nr:sigma-70 family RNA polymerase sigma factor [Deltaproteobacteria bacterium]